MSKESAQMVSDEAMANPGFPVGGVDLVGGDVDSWGGYVLKILYVKTKESGSLGGHCQAHPLDSSMLNVTMHNNKFNTKVLDDLDSKHDSSSSSFNKFYLLSSRTFLPRQFVHRVIQIVGVDVDASQISNHKCLQVSSRGVSKKLRPLQEIQVKINSFCTLDVQQLFKSFLAQMREISGKCTLSILIALTTIP